MSRWLRNFRVQRCAIGLALWGVIAFMAVIDQPPKLWICIFHRLSGLPCPSCGMTRALFAAAHFKFREAFAWHPIGPMLFAAAIVALLIFAIESAIGRSLIPIGEREIKVMLISFVVCMLLCWIIRICIIFGLRVPLPIYGMV